MAKQLTREELDRLFQLADEGRSYKEMADIICNEFHRETLDRSTIYRHMKGRLKSKRKAVITESFCNRGHHSWVEESIVSLTTMLSPGADTGAGYLLNTGARRTCRECGYVDETTMVVGENKWVVPRRSRIGHPTPYAGERP